MRCPKGSLQAQPMAASDTPRDAEGRALAGLERAKAKDETEGS
ncbi:hypothetical protein ACFSRY_06955 [Pontibacter locisalis]|uniref:Uncharacterized protein n=1 Tax=Pontibacter locisalis TaxID=1719035 RepID=A0ABW5IIX0_9BACT